MDNFTFNFSYQNSIQPKERTLAFIRYVARVYRVEPKAENS